MFESSTMSGQATAGRSATSGVQRNAANDPRSSLFASFLKYTESHSFSDGVLTPSVCISRPGYIPWMTYYLAARLIPFLQPLTVLVHESPPLPPALTQ